MWRSTKWTQVLLLFGLGVVLVGTPATAVNAAASPVATLETSPTPVMAGEPLVVKGSNHCIVQSQGNDGYVEVSVGFTDRDASKVFVRGTGFTTQVTAPTTAGQYTLTSWCLQGQRVRAATVAVSVVDPATYVRVSLALPRAVPGSRATITVARLPQRCELYESFERDATKVSWRTVKTDEGSPQAVGAFTIPTTATAGPRAVTVRCAKDGTAAYAFTPVTLDVVTASAVRPTDGVNGPGPTDATSSASSGVTTSTSAARTDTSATSASDTLATSTTGTNGTTPTATQPGGSGSLEPAAVKRAAMANWLRPPSDPGLVALDRLLWCAGLAVLLVMLIGFPAQLFEATFEANHDRIVAPFAGVRRWARRWPKLPTPLAIAAFVVLAVLLYGLADPNFGRDPHQTMLDVVGLLVALPLVTLAFEIPAEWYARQGGAPPSRLRALPAGFLVAVLCAVVSYLGHFQPGYVYGLIAGYATVTTRRLSPARQARAVMIGSTAIAVVCVIGWVLWDRLDVAITAGEASGVQQLVDAVMATVIVVGVQALAFQLLPLTFLDGHAVNSWSRTAWRIIYAPIAFALVFVTLYPRTSNSAVDVQVVTVVALFLAFGVGSVGFWAYFRYTNHAPASRSEGSGSRREPRSRGV